MSKNNNGKQKTPLLTHLVAGGTAGFMEACSCHPLDTIKVRMQLAKNTARNAKVCKAKVYIHLYNANTII
jgi:solute carrier family 25 citrate transporter 1